MLRQRAAQLVGGVGDERPLPRPGRVASRSSMSLRVTRQGRWISSRGVGHRQPPGLAGAGDLLGAGAQRLDRAQRATDHPPRDHRQHGQQQREGDQQDARHQDPLAALEVGGPAAATITVPGWSPGPAGTATTRSGPAIPARARCTVTDPPAPGPRQLGRAQQRREPVRADRRRPRTRPAARRPPAPPARRTPAAGRAAVPASTSATTSAAVARALAVDGLLEREARARRPAPRSPSGEADGDAGHPEQHQPGPQADPGRSAASLRQPVAGAADGLQAGRGRSCGAGSRRRPRPRSGRCPPRRPTRGPAARSC